MLGLRDTRMSPWLYDLRNRSLGQISQDNVATPQSQIIWVSDHKLVWSTRAANIIWYLDQRWRAPQVFSEWKRAAIGKEVTKGILEGGGPGLNIPKGELVSYDTYSHRETDLADVHAFVQDKQAKTDRFTAIVDRGTAEYDPNSLLHTTQISAPRSYTLGLDTPEGFKAFDLGDFSPFLPESYRADRSAAVDVVRWAPDLSQVVVYGVRDSNQSSAVPETRRFRLIGGELEESPIKNLIVTAGEPLPEERFGYAGSAMIAWDGRNRLTVLARRAQAAPSTRSEWWVELEDGDTECLSCLAPQVPSQLVWVDSAQSFVGATKGHVWRFAEGQEPVDITNTMDCDEVLGLQGRGPGLEDILAVRVRTGTRQTLEVFGRHIKTHLDVPVPDPSGIVTGVPDRNGAVVVKGGSAIWILRDRTSEWVTIAESNPSPRSGGRRIDAARLIEYKGDDGATLLAWFVPPVDQSLKPPFATIVVQYPGDIMDREDTPTDDGSPRGDMDRSLVSGLINHGYAVLLPSVPGSYDVTGPKELLETIEDAVVNAVDAGVAHGLVDVQRIGLYGHSFGGYAVAGIIGKTGLFRAAVAGSPVIDLFGQYGMQVGYLDTPTPKGFQGLEFGQGALHSFPWSNPGVYLRNSPITYVKNVNTPLLILSGDLDESVPFSQSVEMYSALLRLNKRVRFVRYFGEGHVLTGVNSADAFGETLRWYDTFLLGKTKNPDTRALDHSLHPPSTLH